MTVLSLIGKAACLKNYHQDSNLLIMQRFDKYIIGKFLKTFFFGISIFVVIVIVFDISEKIDDFLENNVPINAIVFKYYFNFIPYFINLFSPFFIFLSVIAFSSKMALNMEFISIFNSGISLKRLYYPFFITSLFLASFSFFLGNFIIPSSNIERIEFENNYLKGKKNKRIKSKNIQILPGQYIYMDSYNSVRDIAYKFSIENIENGKLVSKLNSSYAQYDTTLSIWKIFNYQIRKFNDSNEILSFGKQIDTLINFSPDDLKYRKNIVETMNLFELNKFIEKEKIKGNEQILYYKLEKHKRLSYPFSTVILTIIAFAISLKRRKGGMGINIALGIFIAFSFILFMQISTTFSIKSNLSPFLSVWIPNILYAMLALVLIRKKQLV